VKRTKHGRAFVYQAVVSRDEVSRSMVGDFTRYLFRGSTKSLVLKLIEDETMSHSDIQELKRAIAELEANR
jgi:predicted transcriptional regulator